MTLFFLQNVAFDVPGRRLIDGLSLTIAAGAVTALVGRNGSGKSTLLKLIAGQTRPSAGRICHLGRDLADYPARDRARQIAYLPQVPPPAEGMKLAELVALGRYPWRGALGRFRPEDHDAVARAMARCGVEAMADRLVDSLSGGERQRGWIAMMLAQGAATLLLDEPTSALDVAHQVEVLALLRQMCHETGLSAVIVLHDVNMAARFCDRVVALEGGRLLLEGPMTELMTPGALSRVYGLPMHVAGRGGHAYALPE
ncbi:ABC transporter ATP-binding protein [Szabonella alba]|uniref:ABC transporter ATP-binding protein n=1 Tax=Szabonella alba TaxID=2804194 RepID=A0A8K0VB92_9RHOB|nr:ABC transporter ATP-binding protein [Szabonella alba]MBL4919029.1 ABC transporter ATP-binding protein [Szabonella alba]